MKRPYKLGNRRGGRREDGAQEMGIGKGLVERAGTCHIASLSGNGDSATNQPPVTNTLGEGMRPKPKPPRHPTLKDEDSKNQYKTSYSQSVCAPHLRRASHPIPEPHETRWRQVRDWSPGLTTGTSSFSSAATRRYRDYYYYFWIIHRIPRGRHMHEISGMPFLVVLMVCLVLDL